MSNADPAACPTVYCEICDADVPAIAAERRGESTWICVTCCATEPCPECHLGHHRDSACRGGAPVPYDATESALLDWVDEWRLLTGQADDSAVTP